MKHLLFLFAVVATLAACTADRIAPEGTPEAVLAMTVYLIERTKR